MSIFDPFHDLSKWILGFADTDWAIIVLATISFVESVFFPIPPDPLLIGVALIQRNIAIWLSVIVTISSVAGALVGYWIGRRFGSPVLYRWFPEKKVHSVENMFQRYGILAILLAAITPLPYKIFAISAGALKMNKKSFLLASLFGRGARYITLGILIFVFGEQIQIFISNNFEFLTILLGATIILVVTAWSFLYRNHTRKNI